MFKLWSLIKDRVAKWTGSVHWHVNKTVTASELDVLRVKLKNDYFIILTRHNGYLSTYAISIAHFLLTLGKRGYYSHVLMNLEDEVNKDADFRFIEATGKGTHFSDFKDVFDPQITSVALLKPKSMTLEKWTRAMDKAKTALGRPYDTVFDLATDNELSCVELVRFALRGEPNYDEDFKEFESMISKYKNLTPQMFFGCPDFEIVWETRH